MVPAALTKSAITRLAGASGWTRLDRPAVVAGTAADAVSEAAGEAVVADGDAEADAMADEAGSAAGVPVTDVFWLLHPSSRLSDRTVPAASVVAVDRIGLIPL